MRSGLFKINRLNLALYSSVLLVFRPQLLPNNVWIVIEAALLIYLTFFVFTKLKLSEIINVSLICFTGIVALSAVNCFMGRIPINQMVKCIFFYIGFTYLYDVMMIYNKRHITSQMIDCFIRMLVVYCVFNLASIIILGTEEKYNNVLYFFGNKFRVSYYLLLLLGLIYCKYYKRISSKREYKWMFLIGIFAGIMYVYLIGCSTGSVALFFFFVMVLLQNFRHPLMPRPGIIITCMILSGLIVFALTFLLNLDVVKRIITDILHEDLTMTGRMNIYSMYLLPLIGDSPIIGYGYGNNAMSTRSYWYANGQNGLFDYVINNGFVGLILFLVLIYICVKRSNYTRNKYGLYVILYSIILIAVVEVTFGMFLLGAAFLIRWYVPENDCVLKQNVKSVDSKQTSVFCDN